MDERKQNSLNQIFGTVNCLDDLSKKPAERSVFPFANDPPTPPKNELYCQTEILPSEIAK